MNDPRLTQLGELELIPLEAPTRDQMSLSMNATLRSAVVHRTAITQAVAKMRATAEELGVKDTDLLPELERVIVAKIGELSSGVDDRSESQDAINGRTSVTPGESNTQLLFGKTSLGVLRGSKQRKLASAIHDFRTTLHNELKEVESAVVESDTSYQEMVSRYEVLKAAHVETNYLENQLRFQPGAPEAAMSLLDDLIKAQESRTNAEFRFVKSQVPYVLSFTHAKQAAGILIREFSDNHDSETFVQ